MFNYQLHGVRLFLPYIRYSRYSPGIRYSNYQVGSGKVLSGFSLSINSGILLFIVRLGLLCGQISVFIPTLYQILQSSRRLG